MNNNKRHMIDFLFPLALLFVFCVSAIAVLLFATDIYSESVDDSARNSVARTSIAYISEKVHQNDEGGNISVGKLGDNDMLSLSSTIDGQEYNTYIYVAEGELREVFAKKGFEVDSSYGVKVQELAEMHITKINSKLYRITCVDDEGKEASTIVGVRS